MVHALYEAHRVLKPNGILLDLRPAARHRRAGLGEGKAWQLVGVMRERLAEDRAANAAVEQVIREGLFRRERSVKFGLDRVMDTQEDFQAWLDDFAQGGRITSHAWLANRIKAASERRRAKPKIVVREPLVLSILRKQG
jgi:hypothetical protein